METTPSDEVISALRVAPISTIGAVVGTVITAVFYVNESKWASTALIITMILGALHYHAGPSIRAAAKDRATARFKYPY